LSFLLYRGRNVLQNLIDGVSITILQILGCSVRILMHYLTGNYSD